MRVLILEEALQSGKGHWPSYIGTIAAGLREAGDDVEVLVHREATEEVCAHVGGTRFLSRNCWKDPARQGALGGIRHNFCFFGEVRQWLKTHPTYDWVCALTMRLQHLLAFALLSRSGAVPSSTRFLLLFVQGFGQYAGPGLPSTFPNSLSTKLARFCFRLMRPAVVSGRVVLAAETSGMQAELVRFTGLPVSLFPHPVPPPPAISNDKEQGTSNQEQGTRNQAQGTLTITCPGFARHEKGNDLLQDAAKVLLARPGNEHLRFMMQWPEPFEMPGGSLLGPDPDLVADERVEFLNHNLDSVAYEELLSRSDLVILPYRKSSYHHRLSRVAIEAASRGIPLVYMSGTWSEEVAKLVDCGIAIDEETPDALMSALTDAVCNLSELKESAQAGATKVARFHSAAQFRELLVGFVNNPQANRSQSDS
jgi:glycosyltransferase involved in cell wall biosynthesis